MAPRILALDLGQKRIGLAVSDALGLLAHGLPTVERKNLRVDIGVLHAQAVEHDVAAFLFGLPRTLDGSEGSQAAWVREFGQRLAKRSKRPAIYWDERLTSVEAEERLQRSGQGLASVGSRLKSKGHVDQMAAVLMLQEYLDAGMPQLPFATVSGEASVSGEDTVAGWNLEDV